MGKSSAITALRPAAQPRRVVIVVGGRAVATLGQSAVDQLNLTVGMPWDPTTAQAVADAVSFDKALQQATRWLSRRMLSRAEITRKLAAAGRDPTMIGRVIDRLAQLGLIDDRSLGQALAQRTRRDKPAGARLLRDKLKRRGITDTDAQQVVAELSQNPFEEALALARQRQRRSATPSDAAARRRLWGLLARRGFDEDVIDQVMHRLGLGGDPE